MTHFLDLSPYEYKRSGVRRGTVNVGWLDASVAFPKGPTAAEFVDKLWEYCCHPVVQTRGFHVCNICNEKEEPILHVTRGKMELKLGTAEIRVFGSEGKIFAAPDLIFHYVTEHQYLPPKEFVDAVEKSLPPSSDEYAKELRKLSLS
jgi:hypothetical protein